LKALAAFDVRRQEVVGKELNRLKEGTNLLNELLNSMNLPAALGTLKRMCIVHPNSRLWDPDSKLALNHIKNHKK
jgi:hypothetical protein